MASGGETTTAFEKVCRICGKEFAAAEILCPRHGSSLTAKNEKADANTLDKFPTVDGNEFGRAMQAFQNPRSADALRFPEAERKISESSPADGNAAESDGVPADSQVEGSGSNDEAADGTGTADETGETEGGTASAVTADAANDGTSPAGKVATPAELARTVLTKPARRRKGASMNKPPATTVYRVSDREDRGDFADTVSPEENAATLDPSVSQKFIGADSTMPPRSGQSESKDLQDARDRVMNSYIGQTLDNQYEIISRIGQGGMSVVYLAKHVVLKKKVAIKMMLPHLVTQASSIQRFQQEAQAASNLVHTNVITIYNFGTTQSGQPYLVMDYLEGTALSAVIQTGPLPVARAVHIFSQIANALAHAHSKFVIHRDLKPSNIILIEQGEKKDVVQIVDFGIAKMLTQDGQAALNLTQTGEVFGSPYYMSPEQCKGEKLDNRSDIYSMGCLMYEVLCGRPPHVGENTLEVLYKHISDVPLPMSDTDRKFPARLEAVVFKCLAKSPSERYQSMEELEKDLDEVQQSQQFSLLSILKSRWAISRLKRLPQSKRERAALMAMAAAACVVLVAGLYPLWRFWNLPELDFVKQGLTLEEDRSPGPPKRDEANILGSQIAIVEADDYLRNRSAEKNPNHIYGALTRDARNLAECGLYQDATAVLKKAIQLSTAINSQTSMPTIYAEIELANVYYTVGAFDEAQKLYLRVLNHLANAESEPERIAAYSARLANCYWHLRQSEQAIKYYKKAIFLWHKPFVPRPEKVLRMASSQRVNTNQRALQTVDPDAFPYALSLTRLATLYQNQLSDQSVRDALTTTEQAEYERSVPELLFQALPSWRYDRSEKGRTNQAITECLLARALCRQPALALTRPPQLNVDPSSDQEQQKKDQNAQYLFNDGIESLATKSDPLHPRHAQALLLRAKSNWSKGRYFDAIQDRLQACRELQDFGEIEAQTRRGRAK